MNMGLLKGNVISDQVKLRVDAARDNGDDRNFWGTGTDAFNWTFQATLARRACLILFDVRSASGPCNKNTANLRITHVIVPFPFCSAQ